MAGLYFHAPFRRAARVYDDSYYVVGRDADHDAYIQDAYIQAVCSELRYNADSYAADAPFQTLYLGGGRPSLLSIQHVSTLLNAVLDLFDASDLQEATVEVCPADASANYLNDLHKLGFDRLSLQVLSFFPDDLEALGAPHSAQDAVRAVRGAQQVGFENFSVDLLFGWSEQLSSHWKANLEQAVQMEVPHVTLIEWSDDEGHEADLRAAKRFQFAMNYLHDAGFEQYEITHFARPDRCSQHQKGYYAHASYLGMGPSAHTFWWTLHDANAPARRWANVRDLRRYIDLLRRRYSPIAYRQTMDWTSLAHEYVTLRLRTKAGLDLDVLQEHYGVDLRAQKGTLLERLVEAELIEPLDAPTVRLTRRGRLVADGITERLLPE